MTDLRERLEATRELAELLREENPAGLGGWARSLEAVADYAESAEADLKRLREAVEYVIPRTVDDMARDHLTAALTTQGEGEG